MPERPNGKAVRDEKPHDKAEVTRLLKDWRGGRRDAMEQVVELVYNELRRMARRRLASEGRNHTLQPTELVNEAAVRLLEQRDLKNRPHFFAIAATCMRRVLMDHARRKHAARRPKFEPVDDLERVAGAEQDGIERMIAIDEALAAVEKQSPRQARIAELKLFAGREIAEIAELLDLSRATVTREWSEAKKILAKALGAHDDDPR